jgi:hypothetical protein
MAGPARANRTPKKRRDWKIAWLQAFERELTVSAACKAAKVGRTTAYDARQTDAAFAQAWDDLEAQTTDTMEREGYRRGVEGVDRDVYHQGEVVGKERQFSDTLLIFMLKARKPEVYRDNARIEHTGAAGGPIQVEGVDLTQLTDDELLTYRALRAKAAAQS